ncbi:SurA domain protein [Thermocrinis albus DSM 14484]|uniref:SurA domain protein n=1 Tax=Thermocrinis albus (strain DSM 14484 / JCM 11386 / HI 11/12) TaxID=638303 RepID=D3SPY0_THEAH|nr:SurA N-terminal domain-containing protein [Thermocrinis albus]ADC89217.1 SurA domain protein [Thermocrinis albus DSM 14484]
MVGRGIAKLSCGVLLLTALSFWSFGLTLLDRVVASVNGEPILESEVLLGKLFFGSNDRKKVLDKLVEDMLLYQYAQSKGMGVPDQMVDAAVNQILQANNLTMEGLAKELSKDGLSLEDLKNFLRREILATQGITALLLRETKVQDIDVELEKLKRGMIKVKREISVLTVDKAKGKKLLELTEKGLDLDKVARDLGLQPERLLVSKGDLVEPLDREVWAAPVGSTVVAEDKDHIYLAKILGVKEETSSVNEEELREQILRRKLEEKREELLKKLRSTAVIRYVQ